MDWHSRYVLAWRLSNTLEVNFCVAALEEALSKGRPQIFNTDQGSQFTSEVFTSMLLAQGVQASMDGRGRCMDNVFVERGILLGLIKATSGSICLFGDPVEGVRPDALRRIGAIVEEPSFYPYLSGRNNLRYYCPALRAWRTAPHGETWPKCSAKPGFQCSPTRLLWAL